MIVAAALFMWGLFGNIRSDFISATDQDKWRLPILFPQVPWWVVAILLVVALAAILEGGYRSHMAIVQGLKRKYIRRRKRVNRKFMTERATLGQYAKELSEANFEKGNLEGKVVALGGEVAELKTEKGALKSQLEEINRHKLLLIVGFEPLARPHDPWEYIQSEVLFHDDAETFNLGTDLVTIEGMKTSKSVIVVNLIIKFENRGTDKTIIRTVRVSLMRKTTRGREVEILSWATPIELSPITSAPITLDGWPVEGLTITQPMLVRRVFEMNGRIGHRLNRDCFIRVSMDAMNQPLLDVNLGVDWEKARSTNHPVPVTPRS